MSVEKRLVLLLSDKQHAALKRLGGESGLSVGVYARSVLLDHISNKNLKLLQDEPAKPVKAAPPPLELAPDPVVTRRTVVSQSPDDVKMREIFGEEWDS